MISKPSKIYNGDKVTTAPTTTKMNWDKPEGWDKPTPKPYKMNWLTRLMKGLMREELDASDQRKYDALMFEIKVFIVTTFIVLAIALGVSKGPFLSSKYTSAQDSPTLLDPAIDFVSDKWDEWNGNSSTFVAKPDTIYQIHKDTIHVIPDSVIAHEVDSILAQYRRDSTRLSDSLKLNQ